MSSKYEADLSQIAFLSNKKNLVSACSLLQVANIETEKSVSAIHSRYSRIRFNLTDFSKKPTLFLSFFLKPEEVRRIHRLVGANANTENEVNLSWVKKKPKGKIITAECMTITRNPWHNKEKKEAASHPWTIYIAEGAYVEGSPQPTYDKKTYKKVSDSELEDFLCCVIQYMNVWEMVFGAPLLRSVQQLEEERRAKFRDSNTVPDTENFESEEDVVDSPYNPEVFI